MRTLSVIIHQYRYMIHDQYINTSIHHNHKQYRTRTTSSGTRHVERGVAAMRIIGPGQWTQAKKAQPQPPRRGRAAGGRRQRGQIKVPAARPPLAQPAHLSLFHQSFCLDTPPFAHIPNNKRRHAACLVSDTARNVSNKAHAWLLRNACAQGI